MISSLHLALGAALAFVTAAIATALCKGMAHRLGIVARPKSDRWHRETIALLGGPPIVLSVVLVSLLGPISDPHIWVLLAGCICFSAVGLYDDLRPLRPYSKFIAQIVIAAAMTTAGLRFPLTGVPMADVLVTMFWIVAITNAFNLLDNMDGLAAGIAAIAGGIRLLLFLNEGQMEAAFVTAVFTGATVGFLLHNFNPASIFMGDAGSLFLGGFVAGLSLVGGTPNSRGTASVLLVPVMMALVPIFDTTLVTLARVVAGRPISQGGRDHSSHRLVTSGLSERQAVLFLYAIAAFSGLIAIYTRRFGFSESLVAMVLFGLGMLSLGVYLGRVRVYPDVGVIPDGRFVRLVSGFPYARQVATAVIDSALIVLAYFAAYRLRFEQTFELHEHLFVQSLPVIIASQMMAFGALRLYQGVWRYTSLPDLIKLAQGVTLGTSLSVLVIVYLYRFESYSRSVFILDWLLLIVFMACSRLSLRAFTELLRPRAAQGQRVLIYGAGDGGVMVLREIRSNKELNRLPYAFLDDDPRKQRTTVQGVPVLGGLEQLEQLIDRYDIAEVILSSSKIDGTRWSQVESICQSHGIPVAHAVLRLEQRGA
jgi:UDP-GlcNAc:undecaprenyl-phosphate GlcNAc-1-phosphate transferase